MAKKAGRKKMTVLLKGMEMPENCSNCVFSIPQIPTNITHAW